MSVGTFLARFGRTAAGAAVFVVACGGSDDEKAPVEVYASQYGNAVCAQWEGCCRANGLTFDRDKCGLYAAIYIQGDVDRHLAAGATFDPAAADKCIAAAVEATKACTLNEDFSDARNACALVWSGPTKTGGKCHNDIECASSSAGAGKCLGGSTDVQGTCAILTSGGKLDAVCGKAQNMTAGPGTTADGGLAGPETVADCGPDLQCNLLSQTCSPRVPLGGTHCNGFNPCEKGLFCDSSGTCVVGLDAGATCDVNAPEQCASGACIKGKCGANPVGTPVSCTGEMAP